MIKRASNAGTRVAVAQSEADERLGRFGVIGKPMVTGSSELVEYPAQPENSPWHHDPVPDEPPISFQDMSAPEPVGTPAEIQESLSDPHDGNVQRAVERPGDAEAPRDLAPPPPFETASPPPSKRRRKS